MGRRARINQKEYKYYVYLPSKKVIISGFELLDDAHNLRLDIRESDNTVKVYSKSHLRNIGCNVDIDSNWGNL